MFIPQNHNREYEHAQWKKSPYFGPRWHWACSKSNFTRSHISSDRVRSGYEISCNIDDDDDSDNDDGNNVDDNDNEKIKNNNDEDSDKIDPNDNDDIDSGNKNNNERIIMNIENDNDDKKIQLPLTIISPAHVGSIERVCFSDTT